MKKAIDEKNDKITCENESSDLKLHTDFSYTDNEKSIAFKSPLKIDNNKLFLSLTNTMEFNEALRFDTKKDKSSFFNNKQYGALHYQILEELNTCDEALLVSPFISQQYLNSLRNIKNKNIKIKLITTTFDNKASNLDLSALEKFVKTFVNCEIKIEDLITNNYLNTRLHMKAYIFLRKNGISTAYIGSSNLTKTGMLESDEWNIKVTELENPIILNNVIQSYWELWKNKNMISLKDKDQIEKLKELINKNNCVEIHQLEKEYELYDYQKEVIETLEKRREENKKFHLIIMATGTGKTVVAACDYKKLREKHGDLKLLFVANRREILNQARDTFSGVLQIKDFGELFDGNNKIDNYQEVKYLFAVINSLHINLDKFARDQFDIIIFDEAHHVDANTFKKVFDYFSSESKQVLGLTATPERENGINVVEYFDSENKEYAYELRLWQAIKEQMLCSFNYYFVDEQSIESDYNIDLNKISDDSFYSKLDVNERHKNLKRVIDDYLSSNQENKVMIFCISIKDAKDIANFLVEQKYKAKYLTGNSSSKEREDTLQELKNGTIEFLCSVDMFNEGLDIPDITHIFLMRPTKSLTVYLQQIGRGLRKVKNKKLEIFDFVNNINYNFNKNYERSPITMFRELLTRDISMIELYREPAKMHYFLPPGCTLNFEKESQNKILSNLKNLIDNRNAFQDLAIDYFKDKTYDFENYDKFLQSIGKDIYSFYVKENLKDRWEITGNFVNPAAKNAIKLLSNVILKSFLYLNSYDVIDYFIRKLSGEEIYNDCLDNLFYHSFLAHIQNETKYKNFLKKFEIVSYKDIFKIKEIEPLREELINILKWKHKHETNNLIVHNINIKNKLTILDFKNIVLTKTQIIALTNNSLYTKKIFTSRQEWSIPNENDKTYTLFIEESTSNDLRNSYYDKNAMKLYTVGKSITKVGHKQDQRIKDNTWKKLVFYQNLEIKSLCDNLHEYIGQAIHENSYYDNLIHYELLIV